MEGGTSVGTQGGFRLRGSWSEHAAIVGSQGPERPSPLWTVGRSRAGVSRVNALGISSTQSDPCSPGV